LELFLLVDTVIVEVCTSVVLDVSGKAGMKLLSVQMLWHPTELYWSQVFCLVLQAYWWQAVRKTSRFRACVWQQRCEACRGGHRLVLTLNVIALPSVWWMEVMTRVRVWEAHLL